MPETRRYHLLRRVKLSVVIYAAASEMCSVWLRGVIDTAEPSWQLLKGESIKKSIREKIAIWEQNKSGFKKIGYFYTNISLLYVLIK